MNSQSLNPSMKIQIINKLKKLELIYEINENNFEEIIKNDIQFLNNLNDSNYYTNNLNDSNYDANNFDFIKKSIILKSFKFNNSCFFDLIENFEYDREKIIRLFLNNKMFDIFNKSFYRKLFTTKFIYKNIDYPNLVNSYFNILNLDYNLYAFIDLIFKIDNIYKIKELFINYVNDYNIDAIDYFIKKNPYLFKTKLTYDDCENIFKIFINIDDERFTNYNHKNGSKKKHDFNCLLICKKIMPYIILNMGVVGTSNLINNKLNSIIIKHNASEFLEYFDILDLEYNIDFIDLYDFPVLADCLKYGTPNTLKFLIGKNIKIVNNLYFSPECDFIHCSFVNFNYKISELFLEYVTNKLQNNEISNFICNVNNIIEYIKTIFTNYNKKKGDTCKFNKVVKKSLKKMISILYNFIINNFPENKLDEAKRLFINNCINELIHNNLEINFTQKFNLDDYDLNTLYFYNNYNIFSSNVNREFIKTKINKNFKQHNLVKNLINELCFCKLNEYLDIFADKGLKIKNNSLVFDSYLNNNILNYIENCYKCSKCCSKINENIDFIIDFLKKNYLKDNHFICDTSLFSKYFYDNMKNEVQKKYYTKEIIEILFDKYFKNGLFCGVMFDIKHKKKKTFDFNSIKNDETKKFLQKIYSYVFINYNLKKFILIKREKNLNNFKLNINKLNLEFKFSPIEETKNINKFIGIEFKKQLNNLFTKNPVHITPLHCIQNLFYSHVFITEKADGITHREHISNITNIKENLNVEYEKLDNISIIFNIINDDNVFENMNYLRSQHSHAPFINNYYFEEENINFFKKKEKEAFDKYILANLGKNTKLWWPKFVWIINENNQIDYLKKISNLKPLDIFKTDGFILYGTKNAEIIKIKPNNLLTIDLKYNNNYWYTKENNKFEYPVISEEKPLENKIYRIYYENNKYYSKEIRNDKKYANNSAIINFLVKCHKSNWNIDNIIKNLYNNNYYQIDTKLNKNLNFKKIVKKYDFNYLKFIKEGNIIDFGCGYKHNYVKHINNSKFVCLDSDLNIILNNQETKNNKNVIYGLYDFSKTLNSQEKIFGEIYNFTNNSNIINKKFDTIIMINTIHNAFPNCNELQNNIDLFANKDCNIIIRYLDRDLFNNTFQDSSEIDFNTYGYIKKLDNNYIDINFTWCHKNGNREYLVSNDELKKLCNKYNIIFEEEKIIPSELNNIEKYFSCFKTIVFKN